MVLEQGGSRRIIDAIVEIKRVNHQGKTSMDGEKWTLRIAEIGQSSTPGLLEIYTRGKGAMI